MDSFEVTARAEAQRSSGLPSATLRVLIANATAEFGGSEQVMLALAERLNRYGVEVGFALMRPGPLQSILEKRGLRVDVFPEEYRFRNLGSVWRCVRWLSGLLRSREIDLLHSNLTAHFIGGWAAKRAGVREIWHLHDYPYTFDSVHWISQRMRADYCIFTTEHLRIKERTPARTPYSVINPNCIDMARMREMPADESVRERLDIRAQRVFLTVARLQEHKGHRYLIDAAARLARSYPDAGWVIAGRASGAEQEAYLKELRAQVSRLGLDGRVQFAGFIADEDMVPLYRSAFALVHPALTEGYGLVLLEAMACGLPVIAAAASGPSEIIQDGCNGLLVPVADAAALADAMQRLLDDPALGQDLRERAEAEMQKHSVDRMVEETVEAYGRAMALPRG